MKGTVIFDFDYTLADTARFKETMDVSRMPEFIFPGAISVLQRFKADGWKLALLTKGDPSWQKRKAACSGLLPNFDFAMFVSEPKETRVDEYRRWPGTLVFVNDDGAEIDALSRLCPEARFVAIRGPKSPPGDPGVPVCADLEEVYKTITGR